MDFVCIATSAGKPRKQQRSFPIWNAHSSITGTKRNKAFLADELLPIFKKLPQSLFPGLDFTHLFCTLVHSGTLGKIAVLEVPGDLSCPAIPKKTTLVFPCFFSFLALSALISHVENSAHCKYPIFYQNNSKVWAFSTIYIYIYKVWAWMFLFGHLDALDFIGNLLALLLTEEGIGLGLIENCELSFLGLI
ncbi:hypothetical protein ACJX0J_001212 (mitochondrion) [Zea mays]